MYGYPIAFANVCKHDVVISLYCFLNKQICYDDDDDDDDDEDEDDDCDDDDQNDNIVQYNYCGDMDVK